MKDPSIQVICHILLLWGVSQRISHFEVWRSKLDMLRTCRPQWRFVQYIVIAQLPWTFHLHCEYFDVHLFCLLTPNLSGCMKCERRYLSLLFQTRSPLNRVITLLISPEFDKKFPLPFWYHLWPIQIHSFWTCSPSRWLKFWVASEFYMFLFKSI